MLSVGYVSYDSRSVTKADLIREKLGGMFVIPNATRWNSLYDALHRVSQLVSKKESEFAAVCSELKINPIVDDEMVWLQEFLRVMSPLAAALDELQGTQKATAG